MQIKSDNFSKENIIEIAELVRNYYFGNDLSVKKAIDKICKLKNVKIEYSEFRKPMCKRDGYYIITLSRRTSTYNDNVTIFNDLGLIFLDLPIDDEITYTDTSIFASKVLLPENLFRQKCEEFNYDVYVLSRIFSVPTTYVDITMIIYNIDKSKREINFEKYVITEEETFFDKIKRSLINFFKG